VKSFLNLILKLRDEHGLTVLFSSHNLHQVEEVCDRVAIFNSGKLQAVGDIEALSNQVFGESGHNLEEIYNCFFEGGTEQ